MRRVEEEIEKAEEWEVAENVDTGCDCGENLLTATCRQIDETVQIAKSPSEHAPADRYVASARSGNSVLRQRCDRYGMLRVDGL